MKPSPLQLALFSMVLKERERQDKKFGSQRQQSNAIWNAILVEEVGEASQEVLDCYFAGRSAKPDAPLRVIDARDRLIVELVQVTAVGLAWLESLAHQVDSDAREDAVLVPPGLLDAVRAIRGLTPVETAPSSPETVRDVDTGAQS